MSPRNILELPTEVIDAIVSQIDQGRDRAKFSRTCRILHESVANAAMGYIDVEFEGPGVPTEGSSRPQTFPASSLKGNIKGINVDRWSSTVDLSKLDAIQDLYLDCTVMCRKMDCRACILAKTFRGLDVFLSSQSNKLSRKYQSLTFRGAFEMRSIPPNIDPGLLEHEFWSTQGLTKLCPQRFEFNMYWKYWDIDILRMLSCSQLVILKIPLSLASDSVGLANAMVTMFSLRSLTVTDMPDKEEFLDLFPCLGLGILSRSESLRELDLSITNFNRPDQYCETWQRVDIEDEPFVKPNEYDFFFNSLFPGSLDDVPEEIRRGYSAQKDLFSRALKRTIGGPLWILKLEKLRLKRIDIPSYAFEQVIDASRLKELRLPYCDVHPSVWSSIRSDGLTVLENIDYELLPGSLFTLLQSQSSLRALGFTRPADEYEDAGVVWFPGDESPTHSMRPSFVPSPLGQGTVWGQRSNYTGRGYSKFPTLDALLITLNPKHLTDLILPADMYDITPDIIRNIGIRLPHLQNLTWGFDYKNQEIRKEFEESFLPNVPCLRKMTLLSVHLPSGWPTSNSYGLAFEAPIFQWYIESLRARVPKTIRYIRYRHLKIDGERQKTMVYYHRYQPKNGSWWLLLDAKDGERMFESEWTPQMIEL